MPANTPWPKPRSLKRLPHSRNMVMNCGMWYTNSCAAGLALCLLSSAVRAYVDIEPNDDFPQATPIVLDVDGAATITGEIATNGDVDLYAFSGLSRGDNLQITIEGAGSFDPVAVVFDEAGQLVAYNDDESILTLDARINEIMRFDSDTYFVAVGGSPFGLVRVGSYVISIVAVWAVGQPTSEKQALFLDFDGATADPSGFPPHDVSAFSATAISPVYAGQDSTILESIRATIESNFVGVEVGVLSSRTDPRPTGDVTTIYFGGFSSSAFAVAEQIDPYNADKSDSGVVYTESFAPEMFSHTPTPTELGVAIGNIASHTIGHLLGLYHVSDDFDLMDDASPADSFLNDQEFGTAALSSDVFGVGVQNAPMLLAVTLGLGGDSDNDLDFDIRDYATIQQCFSPQEGSVAFTDLCFTMDMDRDEDVDIDDFTLFAELVTGPG